MTIREIARVLDAEILCGHDNADARVTGICACDLMSDVLAFAQPGGFLLTGLTNPQVIRTAEMSDLKGVCFVRNKTPQEETIDLAREKEIVVLASNCFMYEASGRLHRSGAPSGTSV